MTSRVLTLGVEGSYGRMEELFITFRTCAVTPLVAILGLACLAQQLRA